MELRSGVSSPGASVMSQSLEGRGYCAAAATAALQQSCTALYTAAKPSEQSPNKDENMLKSHRSNTT